MWDYLVREGLLKDTSLQQNVLAKDTDCGKTRLLESMRGGLKHDINKMFMLFEGYDGIWKTNKQSSSDESS